MGQKLKACESLCRVFFLLFVGALFSLYYSAHRRMGLLAIEIRDTMQRVESGLLFQPQRPYWARIFLCRDRIEALCNHQDQVGPRQPATTRTIDAIISTINQRERFLFWRMRNLIRSNNLHCRRVRVSNKGLLLQSRKVTRWQLAKIKSPNPIKSRSTT